VDFKTSRDKYLICLMSLEKGEKNPWICRCAFQCGGMYVFKIASCSLCTTQHWPMGEDWLNCFWLLMLRVQQQEHMEPRAKDAQLLLHTFIVCWTKKKRQSKCMLDSMLLFWRDNSSSGSKMAGDGWGGLWADLDTYHGVYYCGDKNTLEMTSMCAFQCFLCFSFWE